mmetsp:Transcript_93304/g.140009  ORF Transcript_93304/g.140009 Transcript_93304/m.140009 type:complete len:351 (-) Transcript_93304:836-1888(-)
MHPKSASCLGPAKVPCGTSTAVTARRTSVSNKTFTPHTPTFSRTLSRRLVHVSAKLLQVVVELREQGHVRLLRGLLLLCLRRRLCRALLVVLGLQQLVLLLVRLVLERELGVPDALLDLMHHVLLLRNLLLQLLLLLRVIRLHILLVVRLLVILLVILRVLVRIRILVLGSTPLLLIRVRVLRVILVLLIIVALVFIIRVSPALLILVLLRLLVILGLVPIRVRQPRRRHRAALQLILRRWRSICRLALLLIVLLGLDAALLGHRHVVGVDLERLRDALRQLLLDGGGGNVLGVDGSERRLDRLLCLLLRDGLRANRLLLGLLLRLLRLLLLAVHVLQAHLLRDILHVLL